MLTPFNYLKRANFDFKNVLRVIVINSTFH